VSRLIVLQSGCKFDGGLRTSPSPGTTPTIHSFFFTRGGTKTVRDSSVKKNYFEHF
jgi:hypothetical protein